MRQRLYEILIIGLSFFINPAVIMTVWGLEVLIWFFRSELDLKGKLFQLALIVPMFYLPAWIVLGGWLLSILIWYGSIQTKPIKRIC